MFRHLAVLVAAACLAGFVSAQTVTLNEAVENSDLAFTVTPAGETWGWQVAAAPRIVPVVQGNSVAYAGVVPVGRDAILEARVTGPVYVKTTFRLNFEFPASGSDRDRLQVLVDGVEMAFGRQDELSPKTVDALVEPGVHTVQWKLHSASGKTEAEIDRITIAPTIVPVPVITAQPKSYTAGVGEFFQVGPSLGNFDSSFRFQWYRDGQPVPGANSLVYSKIPAAVTDSGVYYLIVSNWVGSAVSSNATVKIAAPVVLTKRGSLTLPAGRIRDISMAGRYAYVAAEEAGVYQIDLGDPGQPKVVARFTNALPAIGVAAGPGAAPVGRAASGAQPAIITLTPSSVIVTFDSGVLAPQVFQFPDFSAQKFSVDKSGTMIALAGGEQGVRLLGVSAADGSVILVADIAGPADSVELSTAPDGKLMLKVGSSTGVTNYDLSDPGKPKSLGKVTCTATGAGGVGVLLQGAEVVTGGDGAGVVAFSFSNAVASLFGYLPPGYVSGGTGTRIPALGSVSWIADIARDGNTVVAVHKDSTMTTLFADGAGFATTGKTSIPAGSDKVAIAGGVVMTGGGADLTLFELPQPCAPPAIIHQPEGDDLIVPERDNQQNFFVELLVAADGDDLHYQWWRNGKAIAGEDEPLLKVSSKFCDEVAGFYHVTISNACGQVTNRTVEVTCEQVEFCYRFKEANATICDNDTRIPFTLLRENQTPNGRVLPSFVDVSLIGRRQSRPFLGAEVLVTTRVYFPAGALEVKGVFKAGDVNSSVSVWSPGDRLDASVPTFGLISGKSCDLFEGRLPVFINDCSPCISLDSTFVSVPEAGGPARVRVIRKGDLSLAATCNYSVEGIPQNAGGGVALPGPDFVASKGVLSFQPGEASKVIEVAIVDDNLPEPAKPLVVKLEGATGGQLCGDTVATVVIEDDDPSPGQPAPEPLPVIDCVELPGSILNLCESNLFARVQVVRLSNKPQVPPATVRLAVEAFAGDLPSGVIAGVPGLDFKAQEFEVSFAGGAGRFAETVEVFLPLAERHLAATRRFQVRLHSPQTATLCNEHLLYLDLVSCTDEPTGLKAATQTTAGATNLVIDWSGNLYPGQRRSIDEPSQPLLNPARPLVTEIERFRQMGGPAAFVVVNPLPTEPLNPDGTPVHPPTIARDFDYGDAPSSYEELPVFGPPGKAVNPLWPAAHKIDPAFRLGALIDGEVANQPTPLADGDDRALLPDDDGVVFNRPLIAGTVAQITVTASAPGMLDAWIDYDGDGSFLNPFPAGVGTPDNSVNAAIILPPGHPGLRRGSYPLLAGPNVIRFRVPTNAVANPAYARFRFSRQGGLTPLYFAPDGEVEDYRVATYPLISDFGDAPDDGVNFRYPTLLEHGGAYHLATLPAFTLGKGVDFEADGHPDPKALGDDEHAGVNAAQAANGHDEDGLLGVTDLAPGRTATLRIEATVRSLQEGRLDAWIDWNRDGDWDDAGEHCLVAVRVVDGVNTFTLPVPATAARGATYLRLRLTRDGINEPGGLALTGEVEDYLVTIGP